MEVTEFISRCRQAYPALPGDDLLAQVRCNKQYHPPDNDGYDVNAKFRAAVCKELKRSLSQADHQFVRYLVEQEMLDHQIDEGGIGENIKLCAYLLYKLGQVEDSLLLWRAKNTNFDTLCGIDVQLLVGAGVEQTLAFLRTQDTEEAQAAIEYIEECVETGDFKDLDGYRAYVERCFGDNQ